MELFKLFGTIAINGAEKANKDIDSVTAHGQQAQGKLGKALTDISDQSTQSESKISKVLSTIGKGLGAVGKAAMAVGKVAATGIAAGTAALVALGKQSISAYSDYEQLVGGVETLFGTRGAKSIEEYAEIVGKSVDQVGAEYEMLQQAQSVTLENAANAYKTAGLSANEYMETATSLAAALNQSSESQLESARLADQAIIDMSDNANKMGTSMEAIQNAYNGFSKQNYTMLDNLKLGYGGTKEEMERLLADAEKLSGIHYDISSFSDVTEAIHVIQNEIGITGTTAKEAASTIQGSVGMMKSAWQNLVAGMADQNADLDGLIQNFVESVTAVGENILPKIQTFLSSAVGGIAQLAPQLINMVSNLITDILPSVIDGAVNIINAVVGVLPQLMDALINALPTLIDGIMQLADGIIGALPQIMQTISAALPTFIPQIIDGLVSLVMMLIEMLPQIIQPIIDNLPAIIISVVEALVNNLPVLINGCVQLVLALVAAIPQIIQALVAAMPTVIRLLVSALINSIPQLIAGIIQIVAAIIQQLPSILASLLMYFVNYAKGIVLGIKDVFEPIVNWFSELFSKAWTGIQNIWNTVVGWFQGIWDGITAVFSTVGSWFGDRFNEAITSIQNIWSGIGEWFQGIWANIKNAFNFSEMADIGKNMLEGLWNGVMGTWDWLLGKLKEWCGSVLNAIKGWFGIQSPSKVMKEQVGNNIAFGVGLGISEKTKWVIDVVKKFSNNIKDAFVNRHGFDIKSPSNWAKKVGEFICQDLAIGITSTKDAVINSINDLVTDSRSEYEKVMDEMNAALLSSEKKYNDESERLKDSKSEADKAYLEQLKKVAEEERKIYDANVKDAQNAKNKVIESFKTIVQNAIDSVAELESVENAFMERLRDPLYLTQNVKIIGLEDNDIEYNRLADISEQTAAIEEYAEMLDKLKKRENITPEFFNMIRNMSFEEGKEFTQLLLDANDDQFNKFVGDWTRYQEVTMKISKNMYKDEAVDVVSSIGTAFNDFSKNILKIGGNWADEFEAGFTPKFIAMMNSIKTYIESTFSSIINGGTIMFSNSTAMETNWHAKAMNTPMLLDKPTIFGAQNGKLLGGGEAGTEVVSGAETLLEMIRGTVKSELENVKIYLDSGALVGGIAPAMDMSLGNINGLRRRGR